MNNIKLVLLLSGGLDSAVLSHILIKKSFEVFPLFVDYGQLASNREKKYAINISKIFGLNRLKILNINNISTLSPTNQLLNNKSNSSFFPNRNLLLITCASIYAAKIDSTVIAIGINRATLSHMMYPDCSNQFLRSISRILSISSDRSIDVIVPLEDMTKHDIIKYAIKENLSLEKTYSCFNGSRLPCNKCDGCKVRNTALNKIGAMC